ncbi:hypothetical protein [Paenibacillus sp. UASWS1643]|uniref:hypothetical protein n=1 Tax=Paenibacillus sp. UASWS1643 TaxID=2580422 RepID=UPI001239FA29|nr:hypothetical protein [Paenibacillus sp. UASWS1643]KAA8750131.1 hypothetical protein FE296_16175 [Paenibacillus sp. UASWS1643]
MAIINSLKVAYSTAIYRHGTKSFPDIMTVYVTPVKEYASATYTKTDFDRALANGWITEDEYAETVGGGPDV